MDEATAAIDALRGLRAWRRDEASRRRLEATWAERDRELNGKEGAGVSEEPTKTYACKHCGATFPDRFRLAGHVSNQHRKGRKPGRAPKSSKGSTAGDLACPTCCQKLPPAVRVVVEDFMRRGLPEEKAVEVAAAAYGLLTVPGA